MQYKKMQTVLFDGTMIEVNDHDILLLGLNFASAGLMSKLAKLQNIDKSLGSLRTLDFSELTKDEAGKIFDLESESRKRLDEILRFYLDKGTIGIFIPSAHIDYPSKEFLRSIEFIKQIVRWACLRSVTAQIVFGSDKQIDFEKLLGEDAKLIIHPRHGLDEFCVDLFLFLPKYTENTKEEIKIEQ